MTAPSPERARLADALRDLKARTGLSLVGLATKTAFSKSSWDRYLNGRTLPPREAVQDLCRLAGEPDGRCLALWEIAEAEGSGRGGRPPDGTRSVSPDTSPPPPEAPPPPPSPAPPPPAVHRTATVVAVLASVCAVAVGSMAAVALLLPNRGDEPRSSVSPAPAAAAPRCRGAACEGKSPMHMKCGGSPTTLASHHTATGAWLELRYSEECGTSWARMWGTRIGDRIEMTASGHDDREGSDDPNRRDDPSRRDNPRGPVRSAEVQNATDADSYVYTPMTASCPGAVVRACFRPTAGGKRECVDGSVPK
ncbi:helix-turn-helix domain-containing protein [Streptomyces sp. HD]|uniref:helix-turn-helix domain-containing protein n=1 Tax=Streptomyces sp. HD TaxID=3020892 RepID=UPI00232C8E8B|nr:XRE family transcriptional regulator [Streptomyces sp. HD]MDC0767444.1 DUF2690 domain-containing protein [Streptomyces sp. HD]